jgi:hypothetical protein
VELLLLREGYFAGEPEAPGTKSFSHLSPSFLEFQYIYDFLRPPPEPHRHTNIITSTPPATSQAWLNVKQQKQNHQGSETAVPKAAKEMTGPP